ITYGKASFLFTGDMIKEQEKTLLERGTELKSTVLQVGHHGSHTSSSEEFVHAVHPAWAVFSVGADNTFGHPRPEVVKRYQEEGSRICRTDMDGAIVFYTDGEHMRMEKYRK
ncbi:MAG TPA: DNA internalization-related competence protein ComEC/Rec2, partial [Selenomonas sp.]|nr:DNA internalization-related competence protein ComEC/Rec2 [Selenomonas sp.]